MPRPDEHPRLVAMGPGEPTCEVCFYELFPQASDEVCNDCTLNPMTDIDSMQQFLVDSAEREFSLSHDEALIRHMLGDLSTRE